MKVKVELNKRQFNLLVKHDQEFRQRFFGQTLLDKDTQPTEKHELKEQQAES